MVLKGCCEGKFEDGDKVYLKGKVNGSNERDFSVDQMICEDCIKKEKK